jgi:hypothetical protein
MPIFHFQYQGESGWETLGAGEGLGDDPVGGAIDDLRRLSGGTLPAGTYQVIESRSSSSQWQTFELGVDGQILR